ncbi:URN1 (YPR152C) [Zygosaccharomyces parabailii]|nr:URN1 (YPR152C) [Zygosaccharomyces parabailii]
MPRVWSEYVAPDGRNYYYNALTKQSTWKRPESFDEVDVERSGKKLKKIETLPHIVLELANDWLLVLCNNGTKFYHNIGSRGSVWVLPDEESSKMINSLDRNKLVALIGLARGYSLGGLNVYDEIVSDLQQLRQKKQQTHLILLEHSEEVKDSQQVRSDKEEPQTPKENAGLIVGYSSSESESEEAAEEVQHVQEEQNVKQEQRAEINNGLDLINNIEEPFNTTDDRRALCDLFTRNGLNPFSAWPFEMKKIREDPDFHRISDDAIREDIFEEWCASIVSEQSDGVVNEEDLQTVEDGEYEDSEELEPTKYHYLAQIVSKATINPTTIFMDIKEENKSLFKKYNVKDFVKSKKEQETFVSKLLFYYKNMDLQIRTELFVNLLKHDETTIKDNLRKENNHVRQLLEHTGDVEDAYAVETKLFEMEKAFGLWGSLAKLAEDPKYYVLGIRDKMLTLHAYLNTLL